MREGRKAATSFSYSYNLLVVNERVWKSVANNPTRLRRKPNSPDFIFFFSADFKCALLKSRLMMQNRAIRDNEHTANVEIVPVKLFRKNRPLEPAISRCQYIPSMFCFRSYCVYNSVTFLSYSDVTYVKALLII